MFYGSFAHNLDDKGRLVIPRKMREELGLKAYIMKGYDGALYIYKEVKFAELVEKINSLNTMHKEARDFARSQLASVCDLDVDKMGRVQIPTQLLNRYNIGKEVVVVGAGDHIEVWNNKVFEAYEKEVDANFEKIAESLYDKE